MGHFLQKESWSFALLATSKKRGGGLYFVKFQMTGGWCAFVIPKTKTVPESMRGRTGGSLLPLFSFLSPSTPFSPFFLYLLSPSLLIFCFLWSYALRLKPHGFLRQKTDPTITVETWYFFNSRDTSRFILTRIRVGEESFKMSLPPTCKKTTSGRFLLTTFKSL